MANKKAKGKMAKTRKISRKKLKNKKSSITKLLMEFKPEEKVIIKIDSGIHSGMPHRRFHGKTGVVKRKRGSCYEVSVNKGNKKSLLILSPAHLNKTGERK